MKLRLPLLLRSTLIAFYFAQGFANAATYEKGSLFEENKQLTVYNIYDSLFVFDFYESMTFLNNKNVISSSGSISLLGNGSVVFQGNKDANGGVAIYSTAGIYLKDNQSLNFIDNIHNGRATVLEGGGALCVFTDSLHSSQQFSFEVSGNRTILFSGNASSGHGGAIFMNTTRGIPPTFQNNGSIRFEGNYLTGGDGSVFKGGALYTHQYVLFYDNESLSFVGNKADGKLSSAGGLYARAGIEIIGTKGSVVFDGNSAGEAAGALASGYWFQIANNGDVQFINNKTQGEGAAVYVTLDFYVSETNYLLSADNGDVTFKDNFQNVGNGGANKSRMGFLATVYKVPSGKNNHVVFNMRAAEGKSIFFYDALYFTRYSDSQGAGDTSIKVNLNSNVGYSGDIVLSGKYNEGQVLDSFIAGKTELYEGCLSIVDRAHLSLRDVLSAKTGGSHSVQDTYFDFTVWNGATVEIRRDGSLHLQKAQFELHTTLRTGSGASLIASSVDMKNGITFDVAPFLNMNEEASGLTVKTESWSIGGNLLLSNNLDFNGDSRWSIDQNYLLMTDVNSTRGDQNFANILINGLNTNVIGDGYAYQGQWSFSWNGNNLYAHWVANQFDGAELWWDGEGVGQGNGIGVWDQTASNKVWNKDRFDGDDGAFHDLDKVHFTRSGDVTIKGDVSVNGNVKPFGVIEVAFNVGNGDLVWHGDGSIVGNSTIEKYGTGKLIIRTENSFTGGTMLYGGTIRVDTLTGLGTGGVTIHGGLLDLGERGVSNDVTVVGNGALAGIADGQVVVKRDAVLNFLSNTWFRGSVIDSDLAANPVMVEGKGTVNVLSGANFAGGIQLDDADAVVNFLAGNGCVSLFAGSIGGTGAINVISGNHEIRDTLSMGAEAFTGTLTMSGGQMTIASPREFTGPVNLLGGTFFAGDTVRIGTVTVGNGAGDKVLAAVGVTLVGEASKDFLWADSLNVHHNATLSVLGALNVKDQTIVRSGGMIEIQKSAVFKTMGYLVSENQSASLPSGGVVINEGSLWNVNGGFGVYYVDARTGIMTIGSDSIIKENGFFYAENTVNGTDRDGNLLPAGTSADKLPTLTISKGATFWSGNTVKHDKVDDENNWYQTLTGFHNVTLDIDALARIGTFVVKGDGDGKVVHAGIVESIKRAFTPKLEEGKDLRTYLYVLREGTQYESEDTVIQLNEEVHVDTKALANVGATSGSVVNIGGVLKVLQINATGSVTASGGYTNLVEATGDKETPLFLGSFGTVSNMDTTKAQIKLNENSARHSAVIVDTVQAQIGEQTVIGSMSSVLAQNFIVDGADTKLNNRGGALIVEKEMTLSGGATYSAGDKDRFGWVNMQMGYLYLTASSWEGITLGSYSTFSDETGAKVRFDEKIDNSLYANELRIIGNGEKTNIEGGSIVYAHKLIIGKNSHLDVRGGDVNVREQLIFEAGVVQLGLVNLVGKESAVSTLERVEERSSPPKDVQVTFAGDNYVGIMNSTLAPATFINHGFNRVEGYQTDGRDTWVFALTDEMITRQNEANAFAKILTQVSDSLKNITLDTSQLTQSYTGDIQLYSANITLVSKDVEYGEARGEYNQKDAIKNFVFVNPVVSEVQNSMINSLWTMTDAMDSFSSAVTGQLSLGTYRQAPQRHLWGKAFYLNENIGKALNGCRKNSGGYAIGYDDVVSDDTILGAALGQTLGSERTNRGLGKTQQNIVMGMLYGRTGLHSCERDFLALDYMAGYGDGRNRGKFFRNGKVSNGSWSGESYNVETHLTWYRKVGADMSINPYVGLEFVLSQHNAHEIRGGSGDFSVNRTRMHAFRLPVGATFEHTLQLKNKSSLTNYIGASYVPDVVRRNSKATVANGNMIFTLQDARVGRNAVRGYVGSSWQFNEQWNVNIHYEVEAASQKANQTGRLGTSYSF